MPSADTSSKPKSYAGYGIAALACPLLAFAVPVVFPPARDGHPHALAVVSTISLVLVGIFASMRCIGRAREPGAPRSLYLSGGIGLLIGVGILVIAASKAG